MKKRHIITLLAVICLMASLTTFASAASLPGVTSLPGATDSTRQSASAAVISGQNDGNMLYTASVPTGLWNISTQGAYTGSVSSISTGYSVYTNYYFTCNSAGKLNVSVTLTNPINPTFPSSKCVISLYDMSAKKIVASYDHGFSAYNALSFACGFYNLAAGTNYAVVFTNQTATETSSIQGPITVYYP